MQQNVSERTLDTETDTMNRIKKKGQASSPVIFNKVYIITSPPCHGKPMKTPYKHTHKKPKVRNKLDLFQYTVYSGILHIGLRIEYKIDPQ